MTGELCEEHGEIRAACLECLNGPPPEPAPGFCWCGERAVKGRRCGVCRTRDYRLGKSPPEKSGKRRQDWVSTRPPGGPRARGPFVASRRAPVGARSVCPGCGLTVDPGQFAVRVGEGEVWHSICR